MSDITKLEQDYYGKEGKKYLSNSDIWALLKDPESFKKDKDPTLPMLQGSYFHTAMLERHLLGDFTIVDASTRSTKVYKEALLNSPELTNMFLLQKEKDSLDEMVRVMRGNLTFFELIYASGNTYEQVGVKNIGGEMWKGKADIITSEQIIDLKTTTSIEDFKYSAYKYNYDSQAWLYNQLFGKPMIFIVIEKNTYRMGLFTCSEEFLDRGKEKVGRALDVYQKFFGGNATEDINQFFINEQL